MNTYKYVLLVFKKNSNFEFTDSVADCSHEGLRTVPQFQWTSEIKLKFHFSDT